MNTLAQNFQKVVAIRHSYNQIIQDEGSGFNIFSILGLSAQEVRLHSTFIAELLSANGSHSFGNSFCKLFLQELTTLYEGDILKNFNLENYSVEVEKFIGKISDDYLEGGRIDIILCDDDNRRIVIENKIYAVDQENQLLRYHKFDPKAMLIYLTLYGESPSDWSTGNLLSKNQHYHCVSYKYFIKNWLRECIAISDAQPKVKNTIEQYLNIIENYTEQSYLHKMSEEIIKLLSDNMEFYNSVDDISKAYYILRERVHAKFKQQIEAKKPNELLTTTRDGYEIKYLIDEDREGFFYGFYVEKDGNHISGSNPEIFFIFQMLKELNPGFNNNDYYIGWIFSRYFRHFLSQDKKLIFDLNDDSKMNDFTDQIITEVEYYNNILKERLHD